MLRFAEIKDLYEIAQIHTENIKDTYLGILPDEYLDGITYEKQLAFWQSYFSKGNREIFVYEEDNKIAGFAVAAFYGGKKNCGYLSYIHVRRGCENRGIGKSLLQTAASVLTGLGIEQMLLGVYRGNDNAEQFYIKNGGEYFHDYVIPFATFEMTGKKYIWEDLKRITNNSLRARISPDYESIYEVIEAPFCLYGDEDYCNLFTKDFGSLYRPEMVFSNDSAKWGSVWNGIPVMQPQDLKGKRVIITSVNWEQIEQQLIKMGCDTYTVYYPWHEYNGIT